MVFYKKAFLQRKEWSNLLSMDGNIYIIINLSPSPSAYSQLQNMQIVACGPAVILHHNTSHGVRPISNL